MAFTACFLSTVLLGLLLLTTQLQCVQAECQHFYIEEPPEQLECNPLIFGSVGLSCTVAVNVTLGPRDLNIQWFYIPSGASDPLLLETFDYPPVGPSSEFIALQSKLKVNSASGQLAGTYYCQAVLEGGEPLQQSRQIVVEDSYDSRVSSCRTQFNGLPTLRCAENEPTDTPVQHLPNPPLPTQSMIHIVFLDEIYNSTESTMPLPGCTYQYLTQPPLQPTCNPYVRNRLNLACTVFVRGPVAFSTEWFFMPAGTTQPVLLIISSRTRVTVNVKVTSRIKIINVQPGSYYCQVNPEGREPLQQSTQTVVDPEGTYDNLMICDGRVYLTDQSVMCLLEQETTSTSGSGSSSIINTNSVTLPSSTMSTTNASPESTGSASTTEMSTEGTGSVSTTEGTEIRTEGTSMSTNGATSSSGVQPWVYVVAASGGVVIAVLLLVIVPLVVLIRYHRRRRRRGPKLITKSKAISYKLRGTNTATSFTSVHSNTTLINHVDIPSGSHHDPRAPDEAPYYSQLHVQLPGDDDNDASLNSEVSYYTIPDNPTLYLESSVNSNVYVTPNNVGWEWGDRENLEVDASVYQEPNGTAERSSEERSRYVGLKTDTMDYLSLYTGRTIPREAERPVATPRTHGVARAPSHEDPLHPSYQKLDPSKIQPGNPYATPRHH